MKHTPGPWEVVPSDNSGTFNIVSIGTLKMSYRRSIKEQEANARLMAAAPDMLAILEDIVENAERLGLATGRTLFEIKEVIKKASGET